MNLERLQADLAAHDETHWLHAAGRPTNMHNQLHVSKTMGLISGHLEAIDDKREPDSKPIDRRLVADLVIEAARFANNEGFDLAAAVAERMAELRTRPPLTRD